MCPGMITVSGPSAKTGSSVDRTQSRASSARLAPVAIACWERQPLRPADDEAGPGRDRGPVREHGRDRLEPDRAPRQRRQRGRRQARAAPDVQG